MFKLTDHSSRSCDEALDKSLAPIDLADCGKRQLHEADALYIADDLQRMHYAASLAELNDLLDEVRFETALGAGLVWDYHDRVESGELESVRPEPHEIFGAMAMPVEALALLAGYESRMPSPDALFDEPYMTLSHHRVLSTWFAAQLLDSALFRSIAALDRLATMLWLASGRALPTRFGEIGYPAFREYWLAKLNASYASCSSWQPLLALLDHALFPFVLQARDAFTHRLRVRFESHGYGTVAFGSQDVPPDDAMLQHAMLMGFYDLLVRPAARFSTELLDSVAP